MSKSNRSPRQSTLTVVPNRPKGCMAAATSTNPAVLRWAATEGTAPEKNCGKSTLLGVLQRLVDTPLPTSNISPAALFRCVEAWQPTLLIDEADTFAKDNEELRGILNSGHTRESARVVRVVETEGELQPRYFSTWGAKALSGIGKLPATIMSRAVVLKMRRKLSGESVSNLRHADKGDFDIVRRKFARWAKDQGGAFAVLRPAHPALTNRDADNWEPLLALAQLAGGAWPECTHHAAIAMTDGADDSKTVGEELLTDIREILKRQEGKPHILSSQLLTMLCFDDEAPWATYNRGKPLAPRQLAKRLSEFEIKPKLVRVHGEVARGYSVSELEAVFSRYINS